MSKRTRSNELLPDPVIQREMLRRVANWSGVFGLVIALEFGVWYWLLDEWQLLVLLAASAIAGVMWFVSARLANNRLSDGLWVYNSGMLLMVLVLGLLSARPILPGVTGFLVLPILLTALLFGQEATLWTAGVGATLMILLVVSQGWLTLPRTEYGGYWPLAQLLYQLGLLGLAALLAHGVAERLHRAIYETRTLRSTTDDLNKQVRTLLAERKRVLQISTELSQLAATLDNEDLLITAMVDLIRTRYDLTMVLLYTLDSDRSFARLRHASGQSTMFFGSGPSGVRVGARNAIGQALLRAEVISQVKPFKPGRDSYAEVAFPFIVEGQLLGALGLQCVNRQSFDAELDIFTPIAEQVAMALHQFRRRHRTAHEAPTRPPVPGERALAPGQVIRVGAADELDEEAIEQVIARGDMLTHETEDGQVRLAPIALRGEVIGALGFHEDRGRQLDPDDLSLIESVADQVAQAIENLNLFDSAQGMALREQLVNSIATDLQRVTSVDDVLRSAVRSLNSVLADYDIVLRLTPEALDSSRQAAASTPLEGGE